MSSFNEIGSEVALGNNANSTESTAAIYQDPLTALEKAGTPGDNCDEGLTDATAAICLDIDDLEYPQGKLEPSEAAPPSPGSHPVDLPPPDTGSDIGHNGEPPVPGDKSSDRSDDDPGRMAFLEATNFLDTGYSPTEEEMDSVALAFQSYMKGRLSDDDRVERNPILPTQYWSLPQDKVPSSAYEVEENLILGRELHPGSDRLEASLNSRGGRLEAQISRYTSEDRSAPDGAEEWRWSQRERIIYRLNEKGRVVRLQNFGPAHDAWHRQGGVSPVQAHQEPGPSSNIAEFNFVDMPSGTTHVWVPKGPAPEQSVGMPEFRGLVGLLENTPHID